ncbi:MAG: flagellar filament capping protein FliD [Tissierellia bacterium]|nr:flagellar filament capping protein FliD [Tissierellia bacterium]
MNTGLRITGIMSGIDTESMIESLMEAERVKLERVKQDRQLLIWRQEMYNDINKSFANFILNTRKLFGLTTVTSTGAFLPNSYVNLSWVKKATSSDPAKVAVSSTGGAFDGSYSIEVEQLAEGVSMVSKEEIGGVEDGKLKTIAQLMGDNGEDHIKFSINGKIIAMGKYDLDEESNYVIFGQNKEGQNILVDAEGYLVIKDEDGDEYVYVDAKGDPLEEGKEKQLVKVINKSLSELTLRDLTREINSISGLGIRASYDSNIDRFFLQTRETGEDASILIEDISNGQAFIDKLKLRVSHLRYKEGDNIVVVEDTGEDLKLGREYVGQDAIIHFNGAENIRSSSNTLTVGGITLNLLSKTEEGQPIKITVSTDVDAVVDKIKEFIDEYNKLVDQVNDLISQKRYYDYKPLTEAQKKEMDDKEIELWEERAKSGLLRNDEILERTIQGIRASLYEKFYGVFKFITELGITTEEYSFGSAGGRLVIKNEERLRQAIANDAEGVMELLFKEKSEENKGVLVTRIYNQLILGMEDIIKKSGTGDNANLYRNVKSTILLDFVTEYGSISLLDRNIAEYNNRIDDLNNLLIDRENYYYSKFAALETALSRMNAQSMWLMQQFGNY